MRIALALLLSLLSVGDADGGEPVAPAPLALDSVSDIEHHCRAAERKSNKKPDRVFADLSDNVGSESAVGKWREFPNPRALEGEGEDGAPNTQAFVWRSTDGVLLVQFFFQSGSGDWAHFADHCFRPDGTLARVTSTLNTFMAGFTDKEAEDEEDGGVTRIRTRYFDRAGQQLRKTSRLLDLVTKKPVKRSFMDQDDIVYKRVSDLPFHEILASGPLKSPLPRNKTPAARNAASSKSGASVPQH